MLIIESPAANPQWVWKVNGTIENVISFCSGIIWVYDEGNGTVFDKIDCSMPMDI